MFGSIVRANRLRHGWTQEELADKTGLSVRTVSKIETGRIGAPRPATVRLLADAFGLTGPERESFCRSATAGLAGPPDAGAATPVAGDLITVPRQLPAGPSRFIGRERELDRLDALSRGVEGSNGPLLAVIDGMGGIGKTALAVHAARRVADRFPGGQLFMDLKGFTYGSDPVDPAVALERLLLAVGVPGQGIPPELEDRAALWRTVLAGRGPTLIVLDNVASAAQVTPVLPGSAGCLVIATGRRRLAGLPVSTLELSLEMLSPAEGAALFLEAAGADQALTPSAVSAVVELCWRLPLAISIAAALLRAHPTWTVTDLVDRLRDGHRRLSELADGHRSVTVVLDMSYRRLGAEQQRLYRLLGLHPGPDVDRYAAAALADTTPERARRMLDQLLDERLLFEPAPGRYAFHDLVREHAAAVGTDLAREAALTRLLDYYRHAAAAAVRTAYPAERPERLSVPPSAVSGPELSDPAAALDWLDTELPNLLAAAEYATSHGRPVHLRHFSTVLHRHLYSRGRYRDGERLHRRVLATARTTGDRAGELTALHRLGHMHQIQGRLAQAEKHYARAARLARTTGDRIAQLDALNGLGHVRRLLARHTEAIEDHERALQLARAVDDRSGALAAYNGLGLAYQAQARFAEAAAHYRRALRLVQFTGSQPGELDAVRGLGHVELYQGRLEQAARYYRRALRLAAAAGNHNTTLVVHNGLGHLHRRLARYEAAVRNHERALRLARSTGHLTGEADALIGIGLVWLQQGRPDLADRVYRLVLERAHQGLGPNYEYEARQGLGRVCLATGALEAAVTHHERALALAVEADQPEDRARAHDGLAHAYHRLGRLELARRHWEDALRVLTERRLHRTEDAGADVPTIRARLAALDRDGATGIPTP